MNFILKILISSLAVMVSAWLMPGVSVDDYFTGIAVALILSFLNAVLKPLMIVLTLPVTVITLGGFLLVINAIIILITNSFLDGFQVSGFWAALFFSLILSFVTSVFEKMQSNSEKAE